MDNKNKIKVYTTSSGAELNISAPSTKQVISATNNRAQYFAEQAKKYRDEAKLHRDNAKYYAEQNSDVTFEYIDNVRATLENKIATKQESGNYALKEELPQYISELENDAQYIVKSEFDFVTQKLELPSQEGCAGRFLMSDGENESWVGVNSFQLFDTKLSDKVLSYEESKGWALQGSWVYKDAVAGERYGYPDFYNKCLEEYNKTTSTETINGVTIKVHSNGHKFYDIANKPSIDDYFNTMSTAWFYGVDTENERIFLPRNNYLTGYLPDGKISVSVNGNGNALRLTTAKGTGNWAYSTSGSWHMDIDEKDDPVSTTTSSTSISSCAGNGSRIGVATSNSGLSGSFTQSNKQNSLFVYICVGNTVSNTSWIDVVTQVKDGVKDLEIATNNGIEVISNASNALRQTQITNCLLEIPQNIKLELINGTLTLKAGSKVIIPNGAGVYDDLVISIDKTATQTQNETRLYFYNGSYIEKFPISQCYSGSIAPTGSTYMFWYDTTNNLVKKTSDGGTHWETGWSLPFAICTATNGAISSIDQVFNGFGYIGSTVWVDKGVKGLIPNGKNEDGTLNNIEYMTSSFLTRTLTHTQANDELALNTSNATIARHPHYELRDDNYLYYTTGQKAEGLVVYGSCDVTSGVVSNFNPKQSFQAVDRNELQKNKYVIDTYANGTSWYRVWSDHWCEQGGVQYRTSTTNTVSFLKPFQNTNYTITNAILKDNNGAVVDLAYSMCIGAKTTTGFDFYSQTTSYNLSWYACGYIT